MSWVVRRVAHSGIGITGEFRPMLYFKLLCKYLNVYDTG